MDMLVSWDACSGFASPWLHACVRSSKRTVQGVAHPRSCVWLGVDVCVSLLPPSLSVCVRACVRERERGGGERNGRAPTCVLAQRRPVTPFSSALALHVADLPSHLL